MANTTETYLSDGQQAIYDFSFDYISKDFIKVLVDGAEVGWTLTGTYQITLDVVPAAGELIIIQRETSQDRIVDFVDGSILVAKDMNLSALQAIHIAAEAFNKASGSLLIDDNGNYTAGFRRVADLGDPVDDRDAVTKGWAESAQSAELAQAVNAKTSAVAAQANAESARDAAISARDDAQTAEANAVAAENAAETAEANAAGSAVSASSSASSAAASAGNASASASAAATSEANAATSAAAAATFDPALFPAIADNSLPPEWVATNAEALGGTDNTKGMTPLRVDQAIAGQLPYGIDGFSVSDVSAVGKSTVDFNGIPANVSDIEIFFAGLSLSGNYDIRLQLKKSTGVVTSGYVASALGVNGSSAVSNYTTAAFTIKVGSGGRYLNGSLRLRRRAQSDLWSSNGTLSHLNGAVSVGGSNGLGGTLTGFRLQTTNGTFNSGLLSVTYR